MVHRAGDEGLGRQGQPASSGRDPAREAAARGVAAAPADRPDFFVLTGASGGGKSSIVEALGARGFTIVEEPGRAIVREQLATGGDATPWQGPLKFCDLLFARSVAAYEALANRPEPVFFDRAMVDAIGWSDLIGAPVPKDWLAAIRQLRYRTPVFVTPPWRAIYRNDAERRKDWPAVLADHNATVAAWRAGGYELIDVPRMPVAERVAFVLLHAGLGG
ncbi:MAG: AAA family ATPase [Geminicoccaceae bacterium]|nr:AAA family ATPase [Geminicoccaceae bacterium]